ncbi:lysosomal Pro-X carboxypeptidase-like [Rhynchophorus ferrugineus]|uniref:lysosomal Pro-X carboxypeptidase-like n=1 Tax=Rhynchophorus ferrugineus TaxID=354439 RepID=UPI003FCEC50A
MFVFVVIFYYVFNAYVSTKSPYQELYIDVPIDHFTFSSANDTFKLRYLLTEDYYVKGGPTFIYCGNEADITVFFQNTGFLLDIAPQFNALVVFAEHRYYGKSMPFGKNSLTSPEYLKYLSSAQALADFVWLIDILGQKYYSTMITNDTYPFIAFGGSYGGMLAAWLRMKYPHIVLGSIASSAPILQINNVKTCEMFNQIVTNSYTSYNNCSLPIKLSWQAIRNLTKTDAGKKNVTAIFNLCKPLHSQMDINELIDGIEDIYVNLAMLNYPYPTNFISSLPAHPIQTFCNKLQSFDVVKTPLNLIEAIASAIAIFTSDPRNCTNFENGIMNPTEYAWNFQACFELIMPSCSSKDDMFEPIQWDYRNFSNDCFKRYGVRSYKPEGILLEYGGKILKYASNIVFSNGLLDPWSSGGILQNVSETVLAILIPEAAHHYDLRGSNVVDTKYVIDARKFHVNVIKKWLKMN